MHFTLFTPVGYFLEYQNQTRSMQNQTRSHPLILQTTRISNLGYLVIVLTGPFVFSYTGRIIVCLFSARQPEGAWSNVSLLWFLLSSESTRGCSVLNSSCSPSSKASHSCCFSLCLLISSHCFLAVLQTYWVCSHPGCSPHLESSAPRN